MKNEDARLNFVDFVYALVPYMFKSSYLGSSY